MRIKDTINTEKLRLRLSGVLGRINWKMVLVAGIVLSAALMLYHTWMFMTLVKL